MIKSFFQSSLFVRLVIGVVVASAAYAVFLVGSPAEQRALQLDQRRVSDLQQIASSLEIYWQRNQKLPKSFDEFKNQDFYVQSIVDPETGVPYEYRVTGEKTYELCAVFARGSYAKSLVRPFADPWEHQSQRACFQREVTPRLQPLEKVSS